MLDRLVRGLFRRLEDRSSDTAVFAIIPIRVPTLHALRRRRGKKTKRPDIEVRQTTPHSEHKKFLGTLLLSSRFPYPVVENKKRNNPPACVRQHGRRIQQTWESSWSSLSKFVYDLIAD